MSTANDLITSAFQKVNVYNATATQLDAGLVSLNNMLSMWGVEFLNYVPTSESFSVTTTATYTIGSGGTWDTVRPISVEECYLLDTDGYSHPVGIISAKDYSSISSKTFSARPENLYFLPEYPLAKIIFESVPDTTYTAYFIFNKPITELTTLAITVTLPQEYKEAIVYNLAISLGEDWDRKIPQTVIMRAMQTKELLSRLNAINNPPPVATFDITGKWGYNISIDE
jgi:hypothetical protein